MTIPRIEIPAGRKATIVQYTLTKKLKAYVQYRRSMFERCYPISEALAVRMLKAGYKQPSRFGRWCPVRLLEGDCMQPNTLPKEGPPKPGTKPKKNSAAVTCPLIYRQHIYFLSSPQSRDEFVLNPIAYLCQPSPKPVVPMRIAILGPPKSGKSTIARRFVDEYGLVRLSIGEALRMTLAAQPKSDLSEQILGCLYHGMVVPDEWAVQALGVAMMDMRCQTRGYVLDGYPVKKSQVELLEKYNIVPVRVIDLLVDSEELAVRATKDRYSKDKVLVLHDSAPVYAIKLSTWNIEIDAIRDWYWKEHDNVVPIHGDNSKWWVWNETNRSATASVVIQQTYIQRIDAGKSASIAGMCVRPVDFVKRLGSYSQYCPVSLALRNELIDCTKQPNLDYAAEFRGHYYKLAGHAELDDFLATPEKFVPPDAPRPLPADLPKRRTGAEAKAMFPKAVELKGYCPVTYLDGKCRYEAIVDGDPELVVLYKNKLYYMETEEKREKFMRSPVKYCNLKLPHKLPPKRDPMTITSLPMLGYMEQTVVTAVTRALTAVGTFKPKYPFLNPTKSALIYFAYNLKAYNPKTPEYIRKRYKCKLEQFEETCELIPYLGNNMSKRYRDPKDRPIDFDFKLDKFVKLRSHEVCTSMVC